jgi:hypothetical protein
MSWGDGEWGTSPWGGGAPSVAGDISVSSVRFISPTYIRVHLNTQVIVNSFYLDPENYTIALRSDSTIAGDAVGVVRVFAPANEVLIADYIYLETTQHTDGALYDISFTSLQTLDGVTGSGVSAPAGYASRVTKTMSSLKSIPSHFDKRLDALLHAVVAAISIQDDIIGGSRSDRLP